MRLARARDAWRCCLTPLAALALAAGCKPDLGQPESLLTQRRVLAVRGDPPESRPGDSVAYRVLVASPGGTEPNPSLDWAFCTTPKPLDENNIVAGACLGSGVSLLAQAVATLTAFTPGDACSIFGPDPPPQQPGQPPLRPRDPDVSGGFYQPLRVQGQGVVAFGLERIRCNLASAGAEIAFAFSARYVANQNPTLLPLTASVGGQAAALSALPAGRKVTFSVGWTPESAEIYPVFDLAAQALVDHRESLRVSWLATDGKFDHDRTGRGETELETTTDNGWRAPASPGAVHLWVVLRDSRGGVDFASYELTVTL